MSARGDKKALTYIPSSECNLSGQLAFYKRFPGVKPAGNCVILIYKERIDSEVSMKSFCRMVNPKFNTGIRGEPLAPLPFGPVLN